MSKIKRDVPDADLTWAVLRGGPAGIPEESRVCAVSSVDDKVKVVHFGGYEHFERTDTLDESGSFPQIVYRWTTRTEMAE